MQLTDSPTEYTATYAKKVASIQDAFVFVMSHLDKLGDDPQVIITPVWVCEAVDAMTEAVEMTSLWAEIRHTEVTMPVDDVAGYGCFARGGGRKIAFTSRPEAVTYMKRRGLSLSPYRCPTCRDWHLTSSPK